METYLDMQELAKSIHAVIDENPEGKWLEVTLEVPFTSQYMWHDDYGAPRTAHLPVAYEIHATDERVHAHHTGDKYTHVLRADNDAVDVRDVYGEAIVFGQQQYGSAEGIQEDIPRVPGDLEDFVKGILG